VFDDDRTTSRSRFARLAQSQVPLWVLVLVACVALAAGRQLSSLHFPGDNRGAKGVVDQQKLIAAADDCEILRRRNDEAHLHFATAFAWAVRSALMRNNVDQVDLYFNQLLKNRAVDLAVLADRRGKVVVSTEQHLRGVRFSSHFPPAILSEEEVRLERMDANQMRLVLPIHGISRRLGTVMLIYTAH
jgi:hypothetical protein